jgi:DNA-binding beta-propeller fold protein YncE
MKGIVSKRNAIVGTGFAAVLGGLGIAQFELSSAVAQDGREAPRFEVDPLWPKPMPNNWVLGQAIGVNVDSQDHIWIIHRGWDPTALDNTELAEPLTGNNAGMHVGECCNPSPPVMEFDQEGNLLQAWGGPSDTGEFEWPASNHGIAVDDEGYVYIGGNGGGDSQILKFTNDGKFVAQWGKANARLVEPVEPVAAAEPAQGFEPASGTAAPEPTYAANSMDMDNFGRVAKIQIVDEANEGYVADGYLNHRVAVIDTDSGEIKRYWGAYGKPPTDEVLPPYQPGQELAQQFRNPVHCAMRANDGTVYVCDRANDRVQVFKDDGTFVSETIVEPDTLADGSVWDIEFSPDPEQQFLYMTDGVNEHVRVFDRASMEELYNFGYGGRQPGMFLGVHSIAVDSDGNIYTTETYTGKRLQKFVNKGIGPVAGGSIGVPWPM